MPEPIPAVTAAARKAQSVERFLASSIEWSLPSAALASDSRIRAVSRERSASIPSTLSPSLTRVSRSRSLVRVSVRPCKPRSVVPVAAPPHTAAAPTSDAATLVSAATAAIRRLQLPTVNPSGSGLHSGRRGIGHPPSSERSALADALAMPLSPTAAATDTDAAPCTERCTERLVKAQ